MAGLGGEDTLQPIKVGTKMLPADANTWTNHDVILWLLAMDQKAFIPPMITNNISGATLMALSSEEEDPMAIRKALKMPASTDPSDFALSSLYEHIQLLKPKEVKEVLVNAKFGAEDDGEEKEGYLLEHPSGWTYDREYDEWCAKKKKPQVPQTLSVSCKYPCHTGWITLRLFPSALSLDTCARS